MLHLRMLHGDIGILRMNGSDRMWCKVLMFQPIYHVSVIPTDGNGHTYMLFDWRERS